MAEIEEVLERIPKSYTPEWDKLKDRVSGQFDSTFNFIQMDNLKAICPDWFDYIANPKPTKEEIEDYTGKGYKELSVREIEEAEIGVQDRHTEVIWNTLFEAKDQYIADKIKEHIDEINELGLTVIDLTPFLDSKESLAYNTGVFIGVCSAGHDFYEAYWVKLWAIFGWLPEELLKGEV